MSESLKLVQMKIKNWQYVHVLLWACMFDYETLEQSAQGVKSASQHGGTVLHEHSCSTAPPPRSDLAASIPKYLYMHQAGPRLKLRRCFTSSVLVRVPHPPVQYRFEKRELCSLQYVLVQTTETSLDHGKLRYS